MNLVLTLAMLLTLAASAVSAAPPAQEETIYTVQPGDSLWALAVKYLGNGHAYRDIVSATNARHDQDPSFAHIENPGLIRSGWKLLIPGAGAAVPSKAPEPTAEEPAALAPQPLSDELLAEFEAYVEQTREFLNVPGVAVAIVQGGEIVYAEGFGVKEIGSDDPVTADTIFSIGSLGKAMTSMMVASLVDDGLIEWDTPLVEVMPQFRLSDEGATQQITLREALGMTTGLPNIDPILFLSGLPPEDYVEYLADVPLAAPPGESYVYQNEMYSVGAYAAAMAAGAEYGVEF